MEWLPGVGPGPLMPPPPPPPLGAVLQHWPGRLRPVAPIAPPPRDTRKRVMITTLLALLRPKRFEFHPELHQLCLAARWLQRTGQRLDGGACLGLARQSSTMSAFYADPAGPSSPPSGRSSPFSSIREVCTPLSCPPDNESTGTFSRELSMDLHSKAPTPAPDARSRPVSGDLRDRPSPASGGPRRGHRPVAVRWADGSGSEDESSPGTPSSPETPSARRTPIPPVTPKAEGFAPARRAFAVKGPRVRAGAAPPPAAPRDEFLPRLPERQTAPQASQAHRPVVRRLSTHWQEPEVPSEETTVLTPQRTTTFSRSTFPDFDLFGSPSPPAPAKPPRVAQGGLPDGPGGGNRIPLPDMALPPEVPVPPPGLANRPKSCTQRQLVVRLPPKNHSVPEGMCVSNNRRMKFRLHPKTSRRGQPEQRTGNRQVCAGPWTDPSITAGLGRVLGSARRFGLRARRAASVCRPRHDRMEQGPTEPHTGRGTLLLSSGGAGGRVLLSIFKDWDGMKPDVPPASASPDMIGWSRVLLSHTPDAARSY